MPYEFWKPREHLRFDGAHGGIHYELEKLLGYGSYGAVFLASRHSGDKFEQTVAIKLFRLRKKREAGEAENELVFDHGVISRKLNELVTQVAEHHPNIVSTPRHGVGSVDLKGEPGLFMEMELAQSDLYKRTKNDGQRLSPNELRSLVSDLCHALIFLHDRPRPLAHRDLKPDNILWFPEQQRWKLGDLGLAREVAEKGRLTGTVVIGTPSYMSPEACHGKVGPCSDIWALGVIIAEQLTGKLPFGQATTEPAQVITSILTKSPDIGSCPLSAPFDSIVRRCLEKNWEKRITAGEVLKLLGGEATRGVLNSEPLVVFRDRFLNGRGEGPEMVGLPKGEFMMGSKIVDIVDPGPRHKVNISYSLAVGKYPVTFAEWDAYVAEVNDAHKPGDNNWGRNRRPVINVSWEDARGYCNWLSKKTGQRYRLLSEAEWEYACRAGTTVEWYWGNSEADIGRYAVYMSNSNDRTEEVGSKLPNAWGLYDMSGNVNDWVEDCWNESYKGAPSGGGAWKSGRFTVKVLRGGSWNDPPNYARSAMRNWNGSDIRNIWNGFRLARTLP